VKKQQLEWERNPHVFEHVKTFPHRTSRLTSPLLKRTRVDGRKLRDPRREITQTSSARVHNSHALPCQISSKTDLYVRPFAGSLRALWTRKTQRPSKAWVVLVQYSNPSQSQSEHRNHDTYFAVTCESATRNHAHPDDSQAEAQVSLYY
jgi:hypothetical protein